MIHKQFTSNIISWYYSNKRKLPWRETTNPYYIWISEIILQQTRVSQGLPYYQKFVEVFPTIQDLANAREQDVLSLWQGLGYYSRARNMHKCAKVIKSELNNMFPESFEKLLKLPGIGPYTAAAISSLAFNNPTPVVDGNVYRVLARVFGIENNIADAKNFKLFFDLSAELIDRKEPGSYNQGVMELGATVCSPQNPDCGICPVEEVCFARANKRQKEFPVKIKKKKNTDRYFTYLVLEQNGTLAMKKRVGKGIWEGMYEFYLIENKAYTKTDNISSSLLSNLLANGGVIEREDKLPKHILSHQTIYSSFIKINLKSRDNWDAFLAKNDLFLYSQTEIETLPKPVLITNYLNSVSKSINLQDKQ
ncbi:A/G-specific adenine glycosylase [hydrothermal vent metagenome]|uniref:Adenine DNA glycosylase n=1 Tax=hydrothermal vent metagenome TaxID=652676 RepID=A0A3B0UHQ9_9ZZZZ